MRALQFNVVPEFSHTNFRRQNSEFTLTFPPRAKRRKSVTFDCFPTVSIGYWGETYQNHQKTTRPMIICHCTHITDHDINAAIDWMRAADPQVIITPGKIYRSLGKAADCGGCMPIFLDTMRRNDKLCVPADLRNLRSSKKVSGSKEAPHEGRPEGYRLSQQGSAS